MIWVEPVRRPRRVDPGPPHCQEHQEGLERARNVVMFEQIMRKLGDRENEDEVEKQLDRTDAIVGLSPVLTQVRVAGHVACLGEEPQRVLDQRLHRLHEAGRVPAVDDAVVAATATGSSACGPRSRRRPATIFSSTLLTAMIATSGRLMTGVEVMPPIGPRLDKVIGRAAAVPRASPCRSGRPRRGGTISRRELPHALALRVADDRRPSGRSESASPCRG